MTQQHLIRRQRLKVYTNSRDSFTLQTRIAKLIQEELPVRLEEVFNSMAGAHEWLVLDQLDIQLEDIKEDDLEQHLVDRLVDDIKKQLSHKKAGLYAGAVQGENPARHVSSEERTLEAFVFFLQKGVLPWWYEVASHDRFEKALLQALPQAANAPLLLRKVVSATYAIRRLASQFGEEVFTSVLRTLWETHTAQAQSIAITAFGRFSFLAKQLLPVSQAPALILSARVLLLEKAASQSDIPGLLQSWLAEMLNQLPGLPYEPFRKAVFGDALLKPYLPRYTKSPADTLPASVVSDKTSRSIQELEATRRTTASSTDTFAEGAVIHNAGLVIVAPFLPAYFDSCGITSGGKLTDVNKAIALLHYLVFGQMDYREYDTLLNKILCGTNIAAPIAMVQEISAEEQEKSEQLLQSVISYWSVLKNTSPGGLREGFLQRKGTLVYKATWVLQVEQKSIDVLLQHLPWTIGYIRLPWMTSLLQTQWG
jgi:hypothetical protein